MRPYFEDRRAIGARAVAEVRAELSTAG